MKTMRGGSSYSMHPQMMPGPNGHVPQGSYGPHIMGHTPVPYPQGMYPNGRMPGSHPANMPPGYNPSFPYNPNFPVSPSVYLEI